MSLAFSPDGRYALSGSDDRTMKLWNLASASLIRTFNDHADSVSSVAFSHQGTRAVSGSGNSLKVWDITTGKEMSAFTGLPGAVTSVAFGRDDGCVFSGGTDQVVKAWDIAARKEIRTFVGHAGAVRSVAVSPDGRHLLSASDDKTLKLWNIVTGKLEKTLQGHTDKVVCVAFSPNGRTAVSASHDHSMVLWDLTKGKRKKTFKADAVSIAFSPDGKFLLSGDLHSVTGKWDLASGKVVDVIYGGDFVTSVAFSADARFALQGRFSRDTVVPAADSQDVKLKLVALGSRETSTIEWSELSAVTSAAVSSNGKVLLTAEDDGGLALWSMASGAVVKRLPGNLHLDREKEDFRSLKTRTSVAVSPDGTRAVSGSYGEMRLWELATGTKTQTIKVGDADDAVPFVGLSPDGTRAFAGRGYDGFVGLWDTATGSKEKVSFRGNLSAAVFSPDGRYLLGAGKNLAFWDSTTGAEVWSLEGEHDFTSLALSPDVKKAASGRADATIILWDLERLKAVPDENTPVRSIEELGARIFAGHEHAVTSLDFSPNGRHLLSGSEDGTVKVWDVETGAKTRSLAGHTGSVTFVGFTTDGRHAFSGGSDRLLILWDLASGTWLAKLFSFSDGAWAVVDRAGRFDLSTLEDAKYLHWIMPDDPLTPLPLSTFMRDYYEPRLLPRLLAGEKFPPVPDLTTLNRFQPEIAIEKITSQGADTVEVTVTVRPGRLAGATAPTASGAKDLKLFRDGQLVGLRKGEIAGSTGRAQRVVFRDIRLPRREGVEASPFSAYAFNDDSVKSTTGRALFKLPKDLAPLPGRVYLVAIGINEYQNSNWNLKFAVNDAQLVYSMLRQSLTGSGKRQVVPLLLTDRQATKANLQAIFGRLAGREVSPDALSAIPGAESIARATPEDLLIVTYSGHGLSDGKGGFYLFPNDIGTGPGRVASEEHLISSLELEEWYREVDAGDLALVIDACNSAASVGEDFKPGPMGSRGLGQLAYDKGMRILAASQANDVALESDALSQGLLSYALVHDGIMEHQADFRPKDGRITLEEWLAYGAERVPALAEEVRTGQIRTFGRGEQSRGKVVRFGKGEEFTPKSAFQTPALFDFTRNRPDFFLLQY